MGGKLGAVIVSDPKGEVLALYSSPSFDPNIFVDDKNQDRVIALLNDKNLPFFNRAISGSFHPGSIFKPFVAIAALEEGKINEGFTFIDPGVIRVGTFSYTNWYFTQYGKTEGTIDLSRALTRSTDTFFYKLGELTGAEAIANWAYKFGVGDETEIDIPGEGVGLIPSPEWKLRVKGERWFLGNTYHMSIGQGDIALTPVGVNMAISAIANGGSLCKPRIVTFLGELGNGQCRDVQIKRENLDLVKEGMLGACSPGGTGFTFFDFPTKSPNATFVACKTGTAETGDGKTTHAWFVAFGPVDSPEIVATVLVEKGGEGAYVAGPIARGIFDYWFKVEK
jgi:penicillin-binding protein 2